MSVHVHAPDKINHVFVCRERKKDNLDEVQSQVQIEAIIAETKLHSLDRIVKNLAFKGYRTFEDLFLKNLAPLPIIGAAIDEVYRKECIDQETVNEYFDDVAAVLISGYVYRATDKVTRKAVLKLVYYKKAVDTQNPKDPVLAYWKEKGKRFNTKMRLDKDFDHDISEIDLSFLANDEPPESNEGVTVIHVSETITEIYITSDKSSYLPDLDDARLNVNLTNAAIADCTEVANHTEVDWATLFELASEDEEDPPTQDGPVLAARQPGKRPAVHSSKEVPPTQDGPGLTARKLGKRPAISSSEEEAEKDNGSGRPGSEDVGRRNRYVQLERMLESRIPMQNADGTMQDKEELRSQDCGGISCCMQ